MRRTRPRRRPNRGAAILELAILIPLFFLMAIGILEFGRAMVVQEIITNAAREGARRASISGTSHNAALAAMGDYLTNEGISGHTPTIVPNADTVAKGDPITVTIVLPYSQVDYGFVILPWFDNRNLSAQVVMRKE